MQESMQISCSHEVRRTLSRIIYLGLGVADKHGYLPLHYLLMNALSTEVAAMMMIQSYPDALRHKVILNDADDFTDKRSGLPLHLECRHQCRTSVTSKRLELYPESIAETDGHESLPLNKVLWNETSSSEEIALMLIDKYPPAVHHQDFFKSLPLHIECIMQSRPSIIVKFIELYPEG
jgi:hypothetical protein